MYCKDCGAVIESNTQDCCPQCGCKDFSVTKGAQFQVESEKSRLVSCLLWVFLGGFGGHNYYVGNNKRGTLILILTLAGFITLGITSMVAFVLNLIDLIKMLQGTFNDADGNPVLKWTL